MTITITPNGTIDISSMLEDYSPGESRVALVIGLTITFCTLAMILTSARIYVRHWLLNAFGKDDCLLLGALAMTLANGALGLWATQKVGLGRHLVDIVRYGPPLNLDALHLFRLLGPSFYHISQLLIQLSILAFYLRLFFSQGVERLIYVLMLCSIINATSGFLINLVSGVVRGWSAPPQSHIRALWYSNAGISLSIDLAILCLPLSSIWNLRHVNIRKRLGIIATFSVGLLSCICVIIRLCYINRASRFDNGDSPWDFVIIYLMGLVEAGCGVCCASMATLRPLLARWGIMLSIGSGQILKESGSAGRQGFPGSGQQDNGNLGFGGTVKRKITPTDVMSLGVEDLIDVGSHGTGRHNLKPDESEDIELQYTERLMGGAITGPGEGDMTTPGHTRRQINTSPGGTRRQGNTSPGEINPLAGILKENEPADPRSESMVSLAKRRDPEEHGVTT